jgi:hypothetical protein
MRFIALATSLVITCVGLFGGLALLYALGQPESPQFFAQWLELHQFSRRMIGTATLHGMDVGMRVRMFYTGIFYFLTAFTVTSLLFSWAYRRTQHRLGEEWRILNTLCAVAVGLVVLQLMGANTLGSLRWLAMA